MDQPKTQYAFLGMSLTALYLNWNCKLSQEIYDEETQAEF